MLGQLPKNTFKNVMTIEQIYRCKYTLVMYITITYSYKPNVYMYLSYDIFKAIFHIKI